MLLTARQLLHLAVVTKSGTTLGHVVGFAFQTDGQTIYQYEVRRSMIAATFLIHRTQVISIDGAKIVVEDSAAAERASSSSLFAAPTPETPAPSLSEIAE